jgi:starch-binding outer membrane protein, SusD/RagB family
MINKLKNIFSLALLVAFVGACNPFEIEKVEDLNAPPLASVLTDPTLSQVAQLGTGALFSLRSNYFDLSYIGGSIGRECIIFNKTDSRYYTELQGSINLSPSGIFYPWYNSFNATRRRAEIFSRSAANSKALSAEEKKACEGLAKTIQAFVMLNCTNMMGAQGIRTELSDLYVPGDLLNPGAFKSYDESLVYVKKLCTDGEAALNAGGSSFPFAFASGWAGFNTPATFKKFNKAIQARVAMYQKDWDGVLAALQGTHLDLAEAASLATGPRFNYTTNAGDLTNEFLRPLNDGNRPTAVQNAVVTDAEASDKRIFGTSIREGGTAKIRKRSAGVTLGGLPLSDYEHAQYATNTSDVSIIRNEELVLMYAEAKVQKGTAGDLTDAVTALDKVRVAAGLGKLATAKPTVIGNKGLLVDEMLNQRRYSLYMEGSHRWFDMRRYDRLGSLPKDLAAHKVHTNFPKPQNEIDWDARPK